MDEPLPIDLARAPAFRLGTLIVEPSLRQVTVDGVAETLEPRVVQVFVALVLAGGRIVSRDDLVRQCWDGRIVGDDAINRVIGRLRRLAEDRGGFRIETVTRVGYRLIGDAVLFTDTPRPLAVADAARDGESIDAAAIGPAAPTADRSARPRAIDRRVVLGGVAVAALAGVGGWRWATVRHTADDSVAVLPFANLSNDPARAYVCDGIAEEVRSALTRIVRLKVAARTSSELMRNADATTAAARLGVANIVTGSVRQGGGLIRVSAQLVDGSTGLARWSQSYDRPVGDVLAVETGVAQNVATSLNIALGRAEKSLLTAGGTVRAAAHDAFLRGAALVANHKVAAALTAFDAAVAADPGYALARSARAGVMAALANSSSSPTRPTLAAAETEARRAIALAPMLGGPRAVLGFILLTRLDIGGAAAALDEAYRLAPGDTSVLTKYALLQAQLGGADAAVAAANRALMLDPLRPDAYARLGAVLLRAGRYDDAIAACRRSLAQLPDDSEARANLAAALLAVGRTADAAKAVASLPPGDWQRLTIDAITAARRGDRTASDHALAALSAQGDDVRYQLATVHAQRHEADAAFAALDRAFTVADPGLTDLRDDALLAPLRGDPRFTALARRIGFA